MIFNGVVFFLDAIYCRLKYSNLLTYNYYKSDAGVYSSVLR